MSLCQNTYHQPNIEKKPQSNTCSMTFEFGCKKAETKRASPKSRSGQIRVVGSSSSSRVCLRFFDQVGHETKYAFRVLKL